MAWSKLTRAQHRRKKKRYPSDLTDAEWKVVRPLLPGRNRLLFVHPGFLFTRPWVPVHATLGSRSCDIGFPFMRHWVPVHATAGL